MGIVAVGESNGGGNSMVARGACAAPVELRPQDSTVAETGDKPAEQQCEHFSIRGYVALDQKKDPKFCSLSQIFHDQQQYDERYNNSCPFSVAKFRRWDCLKCLDKVKNSDHRTKSRTFSMKQDGTSGCCSISFVRSVDSKRLFPCTQQSSQGKNADRTTLPKNAQESSSKCNSPSSGKKGVTEANTDSPTKGVTELDLQGSSYNHDVTANFSDNGSVDVTALPKVSQIRTNKEGNGTEIPRNPILSEVTLKPNADENGKTQEVLIVDCNMTNVPKPIRGQKGDVVCNSGPREEAAPKRSAKSNCKKKKNYKPSVEVGAPDVKICQRKQKKLRRLSEIIKNDQIGRSRSDIEVDHEKVADLCEEDRSRDDVPPVSHQIVGEILSKTTENKTKYKGVDVDDGSSLMNWLKRTQKKLRTEKKDSEHKDFDSCAANSKSTVEVFPSKAMHQDFLSSVGNMSKKKMLPTTRTQQGDANIQNNNLEINMQKTDDIRQIESENSTQRCLSKANTMSLSKRKMPSTANAQHGDENTGKRTILRTDDQCQMESDDSMQKCLSKVSLGKRDIQNVTGLLEEEQPKKRKKEKLELIHEKQAIIDDIPMDIVELLARNQHERQLMTETDSFDSGHTQSKMTADDDCPVVAGDDVPNYASTVLDTNFQQKSSLASESKQKALQVHVASSTQATSTHPPKLQIPGHLQPHLRMEELVTIASSSPIFSQHKDRYIAEAPAESWSHGGTKKLMWDSFKAAPRDSSVAAFGSQFRPNIRAVDLTSTHATGASNKSSNVNSTHQPVITAPDHCTERAVNQVPTRSFPSAISTMEAGNLYDRRNAGQSGFDPKEPMPATHLLSLMDSSTLAGFPSYETSNRNQMEFELRNSQYTHNQYKGSTSTSFGSNLNAKVPLTLEDLSRHKLQPLTLEDLSRHQLQPNLHRPLRPNPRVGVLPTFLQEEIANWSENCGTQSGYRIGVSKGLTSFDMNKKGNFETSNSGMFSAKWNALQLGSVSSNSEFLSARNSIAQSWTRGKGKITHPLDKFVKQDICVTNTNPADSTAISDDNESMMNL